MLNSRALRPAHGAAMAVVLVTLAGCGGGGGGGGGAGGNDGGGSSSANPPAQLVVLNSTVFVSAATGQGGPTAPVGWYVSSDPNVPLKSYITATNTTSGIASLSSPSDTSNFTVQFKSPISLGPGTYTDTVTITGCYDSACQQPLQDSPQTVAVTYTVTQGPPLPVLSGLGPGAVTAGGDTFTLLVTGSNFTSISAVNWNGAPRPTLFVSPTLLRASIGPTDIAAAGTASVTVTGDASPGSTPSNALEISISSTSVLATLALSSSTVTATQDTSVGGGAILYDPVGFSVNGSTSATYYYSISFTGSAVENMSLAGATSIYPGITPPPGPAAGRISGPAPGATITGSFSGTAGFLDQVQMVSAAELGAGTFNDTITIAVCYDSACTHPVSGSPKQVAVSYVITGDPIPNARFLVQVPSLSTEAPSSSASSPTAILTVMGV